MQTQNRILDDLARVAGGAINTLGGLREEIEVRVRERLERVAGEMELVTREEFDALRSMVVKTREEQEALSAKIDELVAKIDTMQQTTEKKTTRKSAATEAKSGTKATSRRISSSKTTRKADDPEA
ncbi:MAG: accessory factor UbiK family protein [Geminicoccaceae bacterium]